MLILEVVLVVLIANVNMAKGANLAKNGMGDTRLRLEMVLSGRKGGEWGPNAKAILHTAQAVCRRTSRHGKSRKGRPTAQINNHHIQYTYIINIAGEIDSFFFSLSLHAKQSCTPVSIEFPE